MERMGKKQMAKWVVPVVGSIAAVSMAVILLLPMLLMEPRDIPVAILSEDAGISTDGETLNVGDSLIEQLTEDTSQDTTADDGESPYSAEMINWTIFDSSAELDEAMDEGRFYAALIIPANYSELYVAQNGKAALGDQLIEKLPSLVEGTSALGTGAQTLSTGAESLAEGTSTLSAGAEKLSSASSELPAQTESLASGASSISSGAQSVARGLPSLVEGLAGIESASDAASGQITQANEALARLREAMASNDEQGALAALGEASTALAYANAYATAARDGSSQAKGGAQALSAGSEQLAAGAEALASGTAALSQGASTLSSSIDALASGSSKLDSGAQALASGAGALGNGTASLVQGLAQADTALDALPDVEGEPVISVRINQGRNPMVSSSLTSALTSLGSSSGIAFDITYMNPMPEGMSMGFTHMMLMIFTYIGSYGTAAVIANMIKLNRKTKATLAKTLFIQLAYMVMLAALIATCVSAVIWLATQASISYGNLAAYIFIASLTFQLLTVASLDWLGMPGMAIPICILVIGMGTAYLPTEFLPDLWRDAVYPWDPLRFMVDGFREILYMGKGVVNNSTLPLLSVMLISAIAFLANLLRPAKGTSAHYNDGTKKTTTRAIKASEYHLEEGNDMNIIEAIEQRHSVRAYKDEPIPGDAIEALQQAIREGNEESGLSMQLVTNEPKAFSGMMAKYGKFSGVKNYIALIGDKSMANLDETCGYYGEKLVLLAQQLGLNTCWVGMTFKKVPSAYEIKPGQKLVIVISLGYGVTQGQDHIVKSPAEVCPGIAEAPDWFARGVDMALLAPTAVNQQRFSFAYKGQNQVEAKAGRGFFSKVDLGIVKLHFEIGAAPESVKWAD